MKEIPPRAFKRFRQDPRGWMVDWICVVTAVTLATEGPYRDRADCIEAVGEEDIEPTWIDRPEASL